jgi:hypothetical protein
MFTHAPNQKKFEIVATSVRSLKSLLDFVYTCRLEDGAVDADLLMAADRFNLPELFRLCQKRYASKKY